MSEVSLPLVDEDATRALGAAIARATADTRVRVALDGPLGAGKSTLVRGALAELGWTGAVPSPTYTLVEPYPADRLVWHLDLYRLEAPEAWYALGVDEAEPDLLFVEWPQQAGDEQVRADMVAELAYAGTARQARLVARTPSGATIIERLSRHFQSNI